MTTERLTLQRILPHLTTALTAVVGLLLYHVPARVPLAVPYLWFILVGSGFLVVSGLVILAMQYCFPDPPNEEE